MRNQGTSDGAGRRGFLLWSRGEMRNHWGGIGAYRGSSRNHWGGFGALHPGVARIPRTPTHAEYGSRCVWPDRDPTAWAIRVIAACTIVFTLGERSHAGSQIA